MEWTPVWTSEDLLQRFPDLKEEAALDRQPTFRVPKDRIAEVARFIKEDPAFGMDMLVDLCGVDYPDRAERFETVYHFLSTKSLKRLRLKAAAPGPEPTIPSIVPVYPGANWFEREAWDLYGIRYEGHPNLKRLLTGDYFKGHALRKDYPAGKRWPVTVDDVYRNIPPKNETDDREMMVINLGPSHPSMHGTFRVLAQFDGEIVAWADVEVGYLHRCFEKMSETHIYQQVIPYTDRLNYCSPYLNNAAYCRTVEQMLGIEVPERTQLIRVILGELSRITDHMVCLGANIVDIGALTNYWYLFQPREEILGVLEAVCGSRLTVSACRIGGMLHDVPENFKAMVERVLKMTPPLLDDVDRLLSANTIFHERTMGVGAVTPAQAIEYGWTGPCLRACGVPYDVRKAYPYYHYDEFDWDIPVGTAGDTYDRYQVRMEEMRQSLKIVRQALDRMEPGPVMVDDPRLALPPKGEVYNTMEGLIYQFEKVMFGLKPPKGEFYGFGEGANGELGFYIVSDGTPKPHRIKVRPPCYAIYQYFPQMMVGGMLADAIAILGSLNIIAGELDR
jgi:NADH-quinone oxidoreductase subunit C/D